MSELTNEETEEPATVGFRGFALEEPSTVGLRGFVSEETDDSVQEVQQNEVKELQRFD